MAITTVSITSTRMHDSLYVYVYVLTYIYLCKYITSSTLTRSRPVITHRHTHHLLVNRVTVWCTQCDGGPAGGRVRAGMLRFSLILRKLRALVDYNIKINVRISLRFSDYSYYQFKLFLKI